MGAWASVTCNGADTDHLILRQHHLEILIIRMLCLIFRVHQINNSEISAGCAARPGGVRGEHHSVMCGVKSPQSNYLCCAVRGCKL